MDSVTDFDSMPAGEELDVLVAKLVFGQTDFSHLTAAYEEGTTPDGEDGWDGFYCPRCKRDQSSYGHPCVQHYSTNIADAWDVVERIVGDCESDCFIESWSDGEWFVASHPMGYSSREPSARCDGKATGKPSLPLAICRWALKRAV